MNIAGLLAVGYDEPCPFCQEEKVKKVFINGHNKNLMNHMMDKHKERFHSMLFAEGVDRGMNSNRQEK